VGGEADPTTTYLRGLWYDGVNDQSLLENFVLHHTFTVSMWIRAEDNGNLFSISMPSGVLPGDETVFNLLAENGNLRVIYKSEDTNLDFVSTSPAYTTFDWHYVTVAVSFNGSEKESALTLRSRDAVIGETTFTGAFIDDSTYIHKLGAEQDTIASISVAVGFYKGFIWNFCAHSIYKSTVADDIEEPDGSCGPNRCHECPVDDCLIDCDVDQRLENDQCVDCSGICDTCIRQENCHPCFDPECDTCLFWTNCS
jgi:hypothetical protein